MVKYVSKLVVISLIHKHVKIKHITPLNNKIWAQPVETDFYLSFHILFETNTHIHTF